MGIRARALSFALLAGLLLVPAASAGHAHRVKLAIVALPKSALGSAGRSLPLAHGSGVVSNANAANNSAEGSPTTFIKLGRITGYELIYGDRYSGGSGVTQISTGVDEYRKSSGAKGALAFWRKDDPKITVLDPYGLTATVTTLKAARVGTRRFALATTLTVPNAVPHTFVDERFTEGRYELHVDVAAGSLSQAAGVAGKLARTLDHRLRLAEAGQLRGKPVKLPPKLKAGPPPGGPDLSTLVLTESDLGGTATVGDHFYDLPSSPAISEYGIDWNPAGTFVDLTQIVDWFPHANDATVLGRFEGAVVAYVLTQGLLTGTPGQFTPVDLTAVGDNAYGGIVSVTPPGQQTIYLSVISLSAGQADDVVLADSQSQIQAADLVNLAQAMANRLNAGLAG